MTTIRKFMALAVVGGALFATGACNRDRIDRDRSPDLDRPTTGAHERPSTREPGTTTVTGASVINNQSAIDKIVAARCARESTCKDVGPDKRVGNSDACVQKLKADMRSDLNVNECPVGIDAKELNECLDAIRKEDCNNPLDTIGRLAACRTSDLCLKTTAPNR